MADRMKVLRNREGEYSIWPEDRENPLGWNDVGKVGPESECQRFISEAWADLRPLGLRERSARLREAQQKILRDGRR